jgi:signal transduction histidine kinase
MEENRTMIEPGLIRVFKIFTLMQIGLFVALVGLDVIWFNFFSPVIQARNVVSLVVWTLLFGYLSWPQLHKLLKRYYLPLALVVSSVFPMISNQPILKLTIQKNLPGIVISVWQLLPALFTPLVLIAWQYPFKVVVLFCIYTGIFDFYLLSVISQSVYLPLWIMIGLISSRTISFGVVGYMISTLMANQRYQKQAIQQANMQLIKQADALEHLTLTRERNRLARDLHDTLAHTLSGMAVNLEAIKIVVPEDQAEVQKMLDHSLLAARKGLNDTRRALRDLRPTQLEDMGLSGALHMILETAAERGELRHSIQLPDRIPTLLPDTEQAIYRIAQEALENIVRHANASKIQFKLDFPPAGGFLMEIMDDGVGISNAAQVEHDHYGIRGMHERADSIGATLQILAAESGGTVVSLRKEGHHDSRTHL